MSRAIRYVNCGHPSPVLLRASGGCEMLDATATVLGAFQSRGFEEGQVSLGEGDRLVLFSDGFSEAKMDEESDSWAIDTICALGRRHTKGLAGALTAAATASGEQADDVTVMDIRAM